MIESVDAEAGDTEESHLQRRDCCWLVANLYPALSRPCGL